jgi:hypothetical protein
MRLLTCVQIGKFTGDLKMYFNVAEASYFSSDCRNVSPRLTGTEYAVIKDGAPPCGRVRAEQRNVLNLPAAVLYERATSVAAPYEGTDERNSSTLWEIQELQGAGLTGPCCAFQFG